MPGLKPPPPEDPEEEFDSFDVQIPFMTLQSQETGQVTPVITLKELIHFLRTVRKHCDEVDANSALQQIIHLLRQCQRKFDP